MKIGTTELILVIIIALVVFGPGKLPELGRMLGKAIGSIKHYSDPNTWEKQASAEEAELRKEEREKEETAQARAQEAGPDQPAQRKEETSDATVQPVSNKDVVSGSTAASAGVISAAPDAPIPAGSEAGVPAEEGLPIKIDVSAEASDEDSVNLSEMEGKSIDEIASSLLKATKQDADA